VDCESGAPDTIRTCDLTLRRGALYPAELRGQEQLTVIGGAEEDRTPDLRIANATLSQLSYGPRTGLILTPDGDLLPIFSAASVSALQPGF
jgi:hypothetical protein